MDSVIRIYEDGTLDAQLRLTILEQGYTESPAHTISEALSLTDQYVVILKTAIRILAGQPDDFSYRSPVLSVSRRKQTSALIAKLEESLQLIEGGGFAFVCETDITALLDSINRYVNEFSASRI